MISYLPLFERARPILLQEPGQRPVREHAPTGLTGGAVVHFVFRVADALYRRSANRTRLAKPAVDGHAVAKSGHSFRESIPVSARKRCIHVTRVSRTAWNRRSPSAGVS